MKITQYRPAFFEGFENETNEFHSMEELLSIPWVANFAESKNFYGFAESKRFYGFFGDVDYDNTTLMALFDYDEKYGGCKTWWVVGNIKLGKETLPLKEWSSFIGNHIDDCPCKRNRNDKCTCGFEK